MSFRILAHIFKSSVPLARGHLFSNPFRQCLRYKSEFVIRAHGIPFSSTRTAVKDFFQGCNIVGEEKGIHRVYNQQGRLSSVTLIELASDEDVEKALERNNEYMGERYIQVNRSDESALNSVFRSKTGHRVINVFGVPFGSSRTDVKVFFQGCIIVGEEKGIHRAYDEKGRILGNTYIELASDEDVDKALERNNEYMGERCMMIQRSDEGALNSVFRSKTGHMVRIWGFDFNATIEDVNLFLSPVIPAEVALKRGYCFVDFHTDEDAQAVLSKDKGYMGQRFVRTQYA